MEGNKVREQYSISSLVLGILSILTIWFYYVSIPTGILALVLGIKEYKNSKSKLSIAGFILGIIGLSLALLVLLLYVVMIVFQYMY